jgi:chromosome partitioning protein
MVDLDPQGNAAMGSGIDKYALELSTYDVLVREQSVEKVRCFSESGGYDVLPSNSDLTAAEVELLDSPHKERRLREALQVVREHYDFMLIDCPPSLNMLTLNGLVAADSVLIPMQCEYFALEGLSALLDTIARVAETVNPGLHVEGLLRTMYDPRNSLTNDVSAQLQAHFGERLYRTVIPRNVRLAEAPSFGMPAMQYDEKSRGAQAYLALAGEVIRRQLGGSSPPAGATLQVSEQ